MPPSEESSFSQGDVNKGNEGRGGRNKRGGDDKIYDKNYCKDKKCYKRGKKGNPVSYYTKTKRDKENEDKITGSNSSRASAKKLVKGLNNMSREFTTVKTQIQKLKEADYDLYESEDEDEASHFYMAEINFGKSKFEFEQLDKEFEPRIAILFNHNGGHKFGIKIKPNLSEVILLDIKRTMDPFCN